jgi:hypothetical protein
MADGHQAVLVKARAEIARLGIADHLPRVIGGLEIARDQFGPPAANAGKYTVATLAEN